MIPLRDNAPTRHFPMVTVALIAANVILYFFYQVPEGIQASADAWAYHPCEVDGSCPVVGENWHVTVFSSMFLHGDIVHLAGNMLFLWIFGNNVEDALGRGRYLVFYFLAGLVATALQTIVTFWTAGEAAAQIPNLGASGAISGVLGAYIVLLPRARILVLIVFLLREIPAWVFLGVYAAFQLWQANFQLQQPPEGGGVAVFAHVGGFAFGVLAVRLFQSRRPLAPRYY